MPRCLGTRNGKPCENAPMKDMRFCSACDLKRANAHALHGSVNMATRVDRKRLASR